MTNLHSDNRINRFNQTGGFNAINGLKIVEWRDGNASLSVDLSPGHLNPLGLVHGGLFAAMLDVALAMSGSYRPVPDDLLPGLTLSLTLQYLTPLRLEDGFAIAKARRTGGGKLIFHAKGKVLAPDGRIIATATGVFKPGRKTASQKDLI